MKMKWSQFIQYMLIICIIIGCVLGCKTICKKIGCKVDDIEKIIYKKGTTDGVLFGPQGIEAVIDIKSKRVVPSCQERDKDEQAKEQTTGQTTEKFDECKLILDEKELSAIKAFYISLKKLDTPKEKTIDVIIVKEFKGSLIRSFYSSATNEEYQIHEIDF